MRPLDENKRSVVRGLEAQSFWRAKREQNFLESCHECSEVRADYGGPYKARPRERVENEVRLDAGYCGDMRPLDENKRSVVRGLEAQSFWRAEREQNILEHCQEKINQG